MTTPQSASCSRQEHLGNIPNRSNLKHPFGFSLRLYRQRNLVENFFDRIKQFLGIATRYERDPANYLAAVKLISARYGAPRYESAPELFHRSSCAS